MRQALYAAVMLLTLSVPISGCSAYKAMNQPDKKDLDSILRKGSDRDFVRSELGQPTSTAQDKEGREQETYTFIDGYDTSTKVLRFMWHFTADVFTICLWELIGGPIEGSYKGDKKIVKVTYDEGAIYAVRYLGADSGINTTSAGN